MSESVLLGVGLTSPIHSNGQLGVDVIQRGEALAIFERDLIIHFQQTSKAAALYVRALLGGIKRALEITEEWMRLLTVV